MSFSTLFKRWKYSFFTPSNVLKIRNVPKEWVDRDDRLFHACFSLLCDFIELESGGISEYKQGIALLQKENTEDSGTRTSRQIREQSALADLYDWYNGIDWIGDLVPPTEEYRLLAERVQTITVPTGVDSYRIEHEGDPQDIARLQLLRQEHIEKERTFEIFCQKQLLTLVSLRECLWN